MLFSSTAFLYGFLPVVLALYYLTPIRWRNATLLAASLFFYFWGEPLYSLLMLGSIASGFFLGIAIDRFRGSKKSRTFFILSVVISVAALFVFKYFNFFTDSFLSLFGADSTFIRIALPLGISFYTFQIISYTVDVYRGGAGVQKSFVNFAAYIAMFPQLVAGPIVRYSEIETQLAQREYGVTRFSAGVRRFIFGLSKKLIIANTLAELASELGDPFSLAGSWLLALAFAFQVYFDFSGYSDMAIGLGGMLGFDFPENFNYPFVSGGVSEFWRRWHITLGAWFRDYIYFPLGGSRRKAARVALNLLIVWLLTGLWHGAAMNFVAWGLFYGVLIILEKLLLKGRWEKLPRSLRIPATFLITVLGFVIFNSDTLGQAARRIRSMFAGGSVLPYESFLLSDYLPVLLIAALLSTPLLKLAAERLRKNAAGAKALDIGEPILLAALLVVDTAYLIDGSFNPFLYFRF